MLTSAAELLQTRIDECEHAGQLTKESFQLTDIDALETHLDMTKRLWPKFSFHLQIKISFRYVQEHLQVAGDLRIKEDKQALKMYAVFAESLDLLGVGPHGDDVAVFSKDASKVCHVFHRLREEERRVGSDDTGGATGENLEEALSAMLQGDGELPLSEEQSELFSAAEDGRGKGSWVLVPMRCSKLVYFFGCFLTCFWLAGWASSSRFPHVRHLGLSMRTCGTWML